MLLGCKRKSEQPGPLLGEDLYGTLMHNPMMLLMLCSMAMPSPILFRSHWPSIPHLFHLRSREGCIFMMWCISKLKIMARYVWAVWRLSKMESFSILRWSLESSIVMKYQESQLDEVFESLSAITWVCLHIYIYNIQSTESFLVWIHQSYRQVSKSSFLKLLNSLWDAFPKTSKVLQSNDSLDQAFDGT